VSQQIRPGTPRYLPDYTKYAETAEPAGPDVMLRTATEPRPVEDLARGNIRITHRPQIRSAIDAGPDRNRDRQVKPRILIVDDDLALTEMLTIVLSKQGYEPYAVNNGAQALDAVRDLRPDLVLLDLMLPGMNGVDVCRTLRGESVNVPILMLTAKTDTIDVVVGLESGADDYVAKPFKPKELIARVRARLRRATDEPIEQLTIGDVDIDVPAHKVTRGERMISLTPIEFDLLVTLARKPNQVFTREMLLEQVWGYRHSADTRLVNVHVQRLRAKLEKDPDNPEIVVTVRGVGYKAGPR
jgi:two-component system, OmpR family, response regulator MtrA